MKVYYIYRYIFLDEEALREAYRMLMRIKQLVTQHQDEEETVKNEK